MNAETQYERERRAEGRRRTRWEIAAAVAFWVLAAVFAWVLAGR